MAWEDDPEVIPTREWPALVPGREGGWAEDPEPGRKPQSISTGRDIVKGALSGFATGMAGIPGFLGDLSTLGNMGINKGLEYLGPKFGMDPETIKSLTYSGSGGIPTTETIKRATELDQSDYEPETAYGRYAKGFAQVGPGAMTGGAGTLRGLAGDVFKFGLAPSVVEQSIREAAPNYPGVATAAGMVTPLATHAAMSPARAFPHAPATEQAYIDHVNRMKEKGFPLSPAQEQGNMPLRYTENYLFPYQKNQNREAITNAALAEVGNGKGGHYGINPDTGESIRTITPGEGGTLDTMLKDFNERYKDINSRNNFHPDPDFMFGLEDIHKKYNAYPGVYGKEAVDAVNGWNKRIGDAIRGGPNKGMMTGEEYHGLLSDLRREKRNATNPKEIAALQKIEQQLTGNMERGIRPEDAGKYKQLDTDYKNALVIEHALTRGSSTTHLSPDAIEAGANAVYGKRAAERGYSPFDWATSAKEVYREPPDSGTTSHMSPRAINAAIGAGTAGIVGHIIAQKTGIDPSLMLQSAVPSLGAAVGMTVGKQAQKVLYGAADPWLRNRETFYQSNPLASVPGLMTPTEIASQNQDPRLPGEKHRTPLRITVTPDEERIRGLLEGLPTTP
jgi:hypothetical protein